MILLSATFAGRKKLTNFLRLQHLYIWLRYFYLNVNRVFGNDFLCASCYINSLLAHELAFLLDALLHGKQAGNSRIQFPEYFNSLWQHLDLCEGNLN